MFACMISATTCLIFMLTILLGAMWWLSCGVWKSSCQSLYMEDNTSCQAEFCEINEDLWPNSESDDSVYIEELSQVSSE